MAAPARNHRGPPREARVGSAVSPHSNYVRGSFAFARSREILRVLHPRFHRCVQWTIAPPTINDKNMETSLPFGSKNLWRKSGFKFPETARLYSHREYAAPKIIPSAANVATKLFLWKVPTELKNSPIKLLVPGELILAKVEEKEMVERFGMVLTKPP
ncbi:hypothetical protein QQ045_001923 [Rhodiola kirilowii]